jgi:hypothetical protein
VRDVSPFQRNRQTPPLLGNSVVNVPLAAVTGTVATVWNEPPAWLAFWTSTLPAAPGSAGRA